MYWGFVIAGYGVVLGGLGIYATALIRRGRRLARQLPSDRRRFLD